MLRIIVADDMPMQVRMLEEAIRRIRPQDKVFTAQNGEEVLAITREREIDLILSDIRMPCLDGLEMLHQVSRTSPDTRVIFITAYALFSYAQQALREGALDYLVKPVDTAELKEKLDALDEQLLRQRNQALQSRTSHLMLMLRAWLSAPVDQLPAHDRQELREQLGSGWIAAIYIPESRDASREPLTDLALRVLLAREPIILSLPEHNHMCFAVLCGEASAQEPLMACLKRIGEQRGFLIGISGYQADLYGSGFTACAEAQRGVDEAFYSGCSLSAGGSHEPAAVPEFAMPEEMRRWLMAGSERLAGKLDAMLGNLRQQRAGMIKLLEATAYNIARCVEGQIYEKDGRRIVMTLAAELRTVTGWQSYCTLLRSQMMQLLTAAEEAIQIGNDPINRCLLDLQRRYMDQISLEEMARQYSLTPNYFSTLFKNRTGQRFVEYLTDLRLERAAEQLRETDDFVYEITARCGYMDERYFIRQFQKHYRMSPLTYRRMYRKEKTQ